MSEVVVKATFKEETRRIVVSIVEGEDPVEYIRSKCSEYFNLKNIEKFNLNYTDADGDEVTLTNASEIHNLIKLRLVKQNGNGLVKVEPKQEVAVVSEAIETCPMETTASFGAAPNNWFSEFKKKKFEKENIVEIKVVKLAWKLGDEAGYLVAKKNGKLAFRRKAKGLRSVWFLKKSDKGDIFCAPASAPKRHLRMMPQTFEINLNDGEMGPWSRWSFVPAKEVSANGIDIASLENLSKSEVSMQLANGCHDNKLIGIKIIEKQKKNNINTKQKKVFVGVTSNEEAPGSVSIEAKVNTDLMLFRFSKKFNKMGMGFGCRKFWRKKCWAKRFGMDAGSKFGAHPGFGVGPFGPHPGFGHHGGFGFGHHGFHHGPHGGFGHHGFHHGPHGGFGHHGHHGGFGHHGHHGHHGPHGPHGGIGHQEHHGSFGANN